MISLTVTGLVLGVRHLGWLQPLELRVYDRMMLLRRDEGQDPRLLIVAITEADIRSLNRATPSDEAIAQALKTLERYQPQVIGLDLYRDLPQEPGNAALLTQLQSPNTIVITKLGNGSDDYVPAPPSVAEDQIGFNDFVIDPDGVIRRSLVFGGPYASFAIQIAFRYLNAYDILPQASSLDPTYMQLGNAVFIPLTPNAGAYEGLDAAGYQVMLNYRSPRNLARQVTLTDVLNDRVNPDWIRGKVVLIGTTAPSGKDLFYTPYSAGESADHLMSGVEIHAQIVSQILSAALDDRPLIWFWHDWGEGLWILAWSLTGGMIAWWVRHPVALGLSSIAGLASLSGTCFFLFTYYGWVPAVAPAIATVATIGVMVAYRAQQAQRQQQMVMTLLGQNTSPEIAAALWNNRDRLIQSGKLPGQKLVATMLFTDIRGFSTLSEQMSPEALLDWLNEYLEAMTQEIQYHHGIVNKFTGDGLLAVFGVPMPRTTPDEIAEDACRAVSCALAMGDRLQALNQQWQQRGFKPIQMRVGIFTGPIVAGSLGGRDRMEYGVIGDSVNIASRLESCAKERQVGVCRILIAEETLVLIEPRFQVEPWGRMELRGKQHLVDVYRVVSHAPPLCTSDTTSQAENVDTQDNNSNSNMETKANSLNLLE
jgi:CHASE2 domain-containing sensor protein